MDGDRTDASSLESETGDAASQFPRALTGREAETLEFMLSASIPGRDSLREQAAEARVVGQCSCGCATIDFGIPAESPAAAEGHAVPLVETRARDMDEHPVQLLLFVRDGRLSSLEIVWYDETQMTGEFPAPKFWEPPTAHDPADADIPDGHPGP
jgi:hypothetical protein